MDAFIGFLKQFPSLTVIYTGGEPPAELGFQSILDHGCYHIAADQGLKLCNMFHVVPDLLIGDFDSIQGEDEFQSQILNDIRVKKIQFPRDKDYTDTELAIIQGLSIHEQPMVLVGGGGFQADHFLSNLLTVHRFSQVKLWITARELILPLTSSLVIKNAKTLRTSIYSLEQTTVSSEGLKWELKDYSINSQQMSVSNVCMQNHVEIRLHQGKALVFLYPDFSDMKQLDFYNV